MKLSLLLFAWLQTTVPEQQEEPLVFRVSSEAVQVDVFVGRNGEVVHGLTKDDFELHDNGRLRDLVLADVTQIPLSIALVLDTSLSVQGVKLQNLQMAAHVFLDALEEQDQVELVTFSDQINRMTSNSEGLHEAVDAAGMAEAGSMTAWHDALFTGLKLVEDAPGRPMVLLFTDGDDTYSWLREDQMRPLIEESNAVLYAVRHEEGSIRRGTDLLRDLAETSGGRLIETDATDRLQKVFLDILTEMKTRYRLIYRLPAPIQEGWHEIEVNVKERDAEVQARRGYFYEARP